MMKKRYLTAAVVAGLACLAPGAAQADLMWSLTGVTFDDGGMATGTFATSGDTRLEPHHDDNDHI